MRFFLSQEDGPRVLGWGCLAGVLWAVIIAAIVKAGWFQELVITVILLTMISVLTGVLIWIKDVIDE